MESPGRKLMQKKRVKYFEEGDGNILVRWWEQGKVGWLGASYLGESFFCSAGRRLRHHKWERVIERRRRIALPGNVKKECGTSLLEMS